ncbi:MAG TPA: endonuclease/exonuclease/phosphatase family protein [Rhodocyclaceae bacterium]|jgi:endonuclease/exonuclease/phosphatase family metal-dependent hydrolase|nr:endonuclease/exonuclease/phosphatase family protein [Rhodocyclaceae bacterium]
MTLPALHVATLNIHKGFSALGRRLTVHELRRRLRVLNPDLVFLQEVQGLHEKHAERHGSWPRQPQHEFLADDIWHNAYAQNAAYDHGHHGNAILSRFPILTSRNQNVTHLRFEKRGLLHCTVQPEGWPQPLHCVCSHLSLFSASRRWQMDALAREIEALIPRDAPLIIAGDFNDWRNQADMHLAQRLGLKEVFANGNGKPTRSFPALLPLMRLDRIYTRGFRIERAEVHHDWARISDHAALSAVLHWDVRQR